jgi:hypothetical protein
MTACTEERFLADVKDHRLSAVVEDATFRKVQFRDPKSSTYWFDLITWPGTLCITGDCGCYVFARVSDMFSFFRGELTGPLQINPSYWGEKLLAVDSNGGFKEWSAEKFTDALRSEFESWREAQTDRAIVKKVEDAIAVDILDVIDEGAAVAETALLNFNEHGLAFRDFWEHDCRDFTFRYLWNLYAIVWGIRQYDKAAQGVNN